MQVVAPAAVVAVAGWLQGTVDCSLRCRDLPPNQQGAEKSVANGASQMCDESWIEPSLSSASDQFWHSLLLF